MLTVPLCYSHAPEPAHHIEFRREDLRMRQERFQNRYALKPRINLKTFRCQAVIDFVVVEIVTIKNTDFKALRRWISDRLKLPSLWCEQIAGTKNSANIFHIFIHDPKIATLLELDKTVAKTPAGLAQPITISKLEVSADFYPRSGSENDRLTMFAILQRTYMPSMDVWKNNRDQPRFVWGDANDETAFFLPSSPKAGLHHQLVPRSAFLDSTVYYRDKNGPACVRIQNKISNQRTESAAVTLTQEEKRARIEVTLTGSSLVRLKLNTLSDLGRFSFNKLQGEHFHFALPTFEDQARFLKYQPITERINQRDRESFAAGGVLCLEHLRDRKEAWFREERMVRGRPRSSHLKVMQDHLKAKGLRSKTRLVGSGETGRTIAYKELNELVRTALQDLGRRITRRERRS